MAGVRQQRKAATRGKILVAAGTVFSTLGYERATMRDIANTARLSTGAIFANWPGKAELYREIYGHAPISAEMGRALFQAARQQGVGAFSDRLAALVAKIEEA